MPFPSTELILLNVFFYLFIFLIFIFGSCGRLSWFSHQLSSTS